MLDNLEYTVYFCKVHQKYIHYFKQESSFNESQCWDCIREANLKKKEK